MRVSIAFKIVGLTGIAIAVTCLITLFTTTWLLRKPFDVEIERRISTMQHVVSNTLEARGARCLAEAKLVAGREDVIAAAAAGDGAKIRALAHEIIGDIQAEFLTFTNASGRVLARGHAPAYGDDATSQRPVADALRGRAAVGVQDVSPEGYSLCAAYPLLLQGRVVGVAVLGDSLIRTNLVDTLKKLTGLEVSLFREDRRVMTTLTLHGRRAVGTRLENIDAVRQVLEGGKQYRTSGVVFDEEYKAIYWPVLDLDGKVLGMWFVGKPITEENSHRNRAVAASFAVAGSISLLLLGLAAWLGVALSRPIKATTAFAVALARGDLDARLRVKTRDEMGTLAEALKSMVRTLRRRIHEEQRQAALAAEQSRKAEEASRRAEEATRIKTQFLANMSHEIRTPMNGILGMCHLALRIDPPSRVRRYIRNIEDSARALLHIINDILDVSKIEAGKMEIERVPFKIWAVLSSVQATLSREIGEKHLSLRTYVDPAVPEALTGDPLRLSQILLNLAGNAVKFTECGSVSVAVRRASEEEASLLPPDKIRLAFSVADTGIGIAPEQLDDIFEMFTQADASVTRRFGGTGLGLAICRRLVEMMGGRISVQSVPGEGTTFFFTLLFATASEAAAQPAGELALPPSENAEPVSGTLRRPDAPHILLAEDNEINRMIAEELLEAKGYRVDVAVNGEEAVRKARAGAYDAVLMDIQMPVMDGLEAARQLRREERFRALPIIAMTAHAMSGDREKSLAAGMQDHVTKPIEPEVLYAALARWLQRAALSRSAVSRDSGPE